MVVQTQSSRVHNEVRPHLPVRSRSTSDFIARRRGQPDWKLADPASPDSNVTVTFGAHTFEDYTNPYWLRDKFVVSYGAKFAIDVLAAVAAIVVLLPVLLIIAALIKLDDGGPIVFAHYRIGKGGRRFPCLKFRSMYVDADVRLTRILNEHPEVRREWQETAKLLDDPRVTRIGKWLRATSLDELPQLFNVAAGDMSLVGPRPVTPNELSRYGDSAFYYLARRPGVTGLWQVSGRSTLSYAARVNLDQRYVSGWTLKSDVSILLRTVPAVLLRRGAA